MRVARNFQTFALSSAGCSFGEKANLNENTQHPSTSTTAHTYVVSHEFCENNLPADDRTSKSSVQGVHTYAELKDDPRSTLPASFTICSSLMTTECPIEWGMQRMLFTILDEHRHQLLVSKVAMHNRKGEMGTIETIFSISYSQGTTISELVPPLFSYQWMRS